MFPEHAVKAYAEVDGQVFQVSLLRTSRAAGLKGAGVCVCVFVHARAPALVPGCLFGLFVHGL